VSNNFQSALRCFGKHIAGDEKLLYFTGNSVNIRNVPSKPDKIGLWFYELSCRLEDSSPYMLHLKLNTTDPPCPVLHILNEWVRVLKREGQEEEIWTPDTILIFDNYYFTKDGRNHLLQENVKYIAAARKDRCRDIINFYGDITENRVARAGQWAGIWRDASKEMLAHSISTDPNIGEKFVFSNAFQKCERRGVTWDKTIIPAYDQYGLCFSVCDNFNRFLHDRTFYFRSGGLYKEGRRRAL
jgi:hypothetical protein